jgi:hypothetical protein
MKTRSPVDQYDLVEIIQIPEEHEGVIDIGDVGVVVEKYNDRTFEIECINSDGSNKWIETLNAKYFRLRSKDPYGTWMKRSLIERPMMQKSINLGILIGTIFGGLIGVGFGAITLTLNGIITGLVSGLVFGVITGALTAALTVKTAGATGGVSVGAYTGMAFGAVFGMLVGMLIPESVRMSANTQGMPVLDALVMGRFETAILSSFLLSILATMVGGWVGGKNLIPRDLK